MPEGKGKSDQFPGMGKRFAQTLFKTKRESKVGFLKLLFWKKKKEKNKGKKQGLLYFFVTLQVRKKVRQWENE